MCKEGPGVATIHECEVPQLLLESDEEDFISRFQAAAIATDPDLKSIAEDMERHRFSADQSVADRVRQLNMEKEITSRNLDKLLVFTDSALTRNRALQEEIQFNRDYLRGLDDKLTSHERDYPEAFLEIRNLNDALKGLYSSTWWQFFFEVGLDETLPLSADGHYKNAQDLRNLIIHIVENRTQSLEEISKLVPEGGTHEVVETFFLDRTYDDFEKFKYSPFVDMSVDISLKSYVAGSYPVVRLLQKENRGAFSRSEILAEVAVSSRHETTAVFRKVPNNLEKPLMLVFENRRNLWQDGVTSSLDRLAVRLERPSYSSNLNEFSPQAIPTTENLNSSRGERTQQSTPSPSSHARNGTATIHSERTPKEWIYRCVNDGLRGYVWKFWRKTNRSDVDRNQVDYWCKNPGHLDTICTDVRWSSLQGPKITCSQPYIGKDAYTWMLPNG